MVYSAQRAADNQETYLLASLSAAQETTKPQFSTGLKVQHKLWNNINMPIIYSQPGSYSCLHILSLFDWMSNIVQVKELARMFSSSTTTETVGRKKEKHREEPKPAVKPKKV